MSLLADGTGWLSQASPGTISSFGGWFLIPSADAVEYYVASRLSKGGASPTWGISAFSGPDISPSDAIGQLFATGQTEVLQDLNSPYLNAWFYALYVGDIAGGTGHLYLRRERQSDWEYHLTIAISNNAPTVCYVFNDPFGSVMEAGGRASHLRTFTAVLSSAEGLAESASATPLHANIRDACSCANGTTVGDSQTGTDWTVNSGGGLTHDAIEPDITLPQTGLAFMLLGGMGGGF